MLTQLLNNILGGLIVAIIIELINRHGGNGSSF